MTKERFLELFSDDSDEKGIEPDKSVSRDLTAFQILEKLLGPSKWLRISAAEHDQVWLDADIDKLIEVASDEEIQRLIGCRLRYDSKTEILFMFV